jgi:hypothetical protein
MISSGDIIKIRMQQNDDSLSGLSRTASTYGYGFHLQLKPKEDTEYIVCNGDEVSGYTVIEKDNDETPIGFVVTSNSYRISQVGYDWEDADITVAGKYQGELPYITPIGSQVVVFST